MEMQQNMRKNYLQLNLFTLPQVNISLALAVKSTQCVPKLTIISVTGEVGEQVREEQEGRRTSTLLRSSCQKQVFQYLKTTILADSAFLAY